MSADLPERPLANSYWILPGELLGGEHPLRSAGSPMAARERLRELMDVGIDCFVDLTMPDELEAYDHELPAGVDYIRRPIRDHGIPARREHMVEIMGDLAHALKAGRRIYLHCRAGIGRTGTVAGCFLIERGESGEGALVALNRAWQQCQRASSWPYVPETQEQIDFVRSWAPTLSFPTVDPPPTGLPKARKLRKKASVAATPAESPIQVLHQAPVPVTPTAEPVNQALHDRFQGALLGLAVGDALAVATQGHKAGSFPPISDLLGGGPSDLPPGAWTDDTAMALCLAESLLECGGFDARDQVERYTRWQKEGYLSATGECVGITPSTARALGAAQWRRQVFAGSHDPKRLDPEILSRVAPPVMFAFGSPEESLKLAGDAARTICQAPLAIEACQLLAAVLYGALAGESKPQVLQPGPERLDVSALRPQTARLLNQPLADPSKPPRVGGSAIDVLSAALWAFVTTDNFRDGALCAVNLGGHSDTIAAAYGQLAGAFYGVRSIPQAWRNRLVDGALITSFADRLYAHARP